jgi:hypothetical protein
MGGGLKLIAEFPHRNPVLLSGFASLGAERTPVATREQHANVKIPTQAKSA